MLGQIITNLLEFGSIDIPVKQLVEIETLYQETLRGKAYTKRPLILEDQCHTVRLHLSQIQSIVIQSEFFTNHQLNEYTVSSRGNIYQVRLNGIIHLELDGHVVKLPAYEIKILRQVTPDNRALA